MRRLATWLLVTGCTCAGAGGPDAHEAAARATLAREGVTELVLDRVDGSRFDFTGRREGHLCHGTIVVTPREGATSTAAMQLECE